MIKCVYCQDTKLVANGDGCPDCEKVAKENNYFFGPIECPFCKPIPVSTGKKEERIRI